VVWYARDGGDREPMPAQLTVFARIVEARLPIALFTDHTFSHRATER
jgi:hypothetical protein